MLPVATLLWAASAGGWAALMPAITAQAITARWRARPARARAALEHAWWEHIHEATSPWLEPAP
jgi:hypothetical protein